MDSTTCDVRQSVRQKTQTDGLPPLPSSIKVQMPKLASMLQQLAAQLGREAIQQMVAASIDLRKAYEADDYRLVSEIYRRGHGWIDCQEGGYCVGVPAEAMRNFANRHRRGQ